MRALLSRTRLSNSRGCRYDVVIRAHRAVSRMLRHRGEGMGSWTGWRRLRVVPGDDAGRQDSRRCRGSGVYLRTCRNRSRQVISPASLRADQPPSERAQVRWGRPTAPTGPEKTTRPTRTDTRRPVIHCTFAGARAVRAAQRGRLRFRPVGTCSVHTGRAGRASATKRRLPASSRTALPARTEPWGRAGCGGQ